MSAREARELLDGLHVTSREERGKHRPIGDANTQRQLAHGSALAQ